MAASGFTPISLYYSTTASAVPTAGNLANGELALNIADMKLYAKNSSGVVTLLASNASTTGVDSLSFGSTGLTPSTATTGAITVAGTLNVANGGTGKTSYTANGILYASGTGTLANGSTLTFDGNQIAVTPVSGNAVSKLFGGTGAGVGSYFAVYAQGANSGYFGTDSGVTGSGTSNDLTIYPASTNNIRFYQGGAEQMRLTSTGLGIGTSSPNRKLEVASSTAALIRITSSAASGTGYAANEFYNGAGFGYCGTESSTAGTLFVGTTAYATILGNTAAYPIQFATNNTVRATLDSSGNLLLGVTSSTGLTGTGDFAMPNNRAIRFRNAANSAYLNMIYVDSSDNLNFGYGGVPPTITFGINGIGEVSRFTSAGGFSVGTTANPGLGAIYATGNITAYYSSDIKFKENVRDIPDALATVNAIGGKLFDWTDEYIESKGGVDGYFVQKADFGVVAQDVQKVFPIAVRTRPDGSLAVDYEKLGALAFAALTELTKRVEALETN